MSTDRSTMEKVLKEHCVPLLKEHGFKGGFPNLYRDTEGFVSLINFQFYSSGGSFCVNLSFADKQRENIYRGGSVWLDTNLTSLSGALRM